MERQISVGVFRPKYVDHLQRWSRIFRSKETETDLSIWIPTEISGIFVKTFETPIWNGKQNNLKGPVITGSFEKRAPGLETDRSIRSSGARFSKPPVITGPVKLFCFPF